MKYVMAIAAAASFMLGFALPLPQSNTGPSSFSVSQDMTPKYVLTISSTGSEPMVTVHMDGTVEYGKDYTPDKAARQFWEAMGHFAPCSEKKEDKK